MPPKEQPHFLSKRELLARDLAQALLMAGKTKVAAQAVAEADALLAELARCPECKT